MKAFVYEKYGSPREAGEITAVIDRTHPFEKIPEAHRNVAIIIEESV